jgi:hypothetical protein
MDQPRRFRWVVQLNHGVVIKAVALSKDRGGYVSRKWSDLDVVNLKCVVHGQSIQLLIALTMQKPAHAPLSEIRSARRWKSSSLIFSQPVLGAM